MCRKSISMMMVAILILVTSYHAFAQTTGGIEKIGNNTPTTAGIAATHGPNTMPVETKTYTPRVVRSGISLDAENFDFNFNQTFRDQRTTLDNKGTEFWLMMERNSDSNVTGIYLDIASNVQTNGVVEIPGLLFSETFAVSPGIVTRVTLPNDVQVTSSEEIENKGIHVMADDEVAVYGLNMREFSSDGFLCLPVDILSTNYMVMSYPNMTWLENWGEGHLSQFGIVSPYDNVIITITPSTETFFGQPVGVPFQVILNQGEVYQVRSLLSNQPNVDLTGSIIESTLPVAVFSGNSCASIPTDVQYCDHIVEQMPPINTWGNSFVTFPLEGRENGDTFRILAFQNGTTVAFDGQVVTTLNFADFYEDIIEEPTHIEASNPVLVMQYSNGNQWDPNIPNNGDPFMMMIPPTEQFMNSYTFATPNEGFPTNYVNVTIQTDGISTLIFNGEPVDSGLFEPIGATGYSGAGIPIDVGSHTIENTAGIPFGIYSYGFWADDSYGYAGGLSLEFIYEGGAPVIIRTNETVQLSQSAQPSNAGLVISATITDEEEPYTQSASLFYRHPDQQNFTAISMEEYAGNVWSATIPAVDVQSPGTLYYLYANDGQLSSTSPLIDAMNNSYSIAVLPNQPPVIEHTPVTTSLLNISIPIIAAIVDETQYISAARLFYRAPGGNPVYSSTDMSLISGNNYEAEIPADYATESGVEYYIYAADNYEITTTYGTMDDPIFITVTAPYITTDDNENNDLQGVPDYDMDVIIWNDYSNHPIEFNIFITDASINSAQLTIYSFDVDETEGQVDEVYLNGNYLGTLTGANDQWSTTVFNVSPSYINNVNQNGGKNLVRINVDVSGDDMQWVVIIDWGQLVINGVGGTASIIAVNTDNSSYSPGDFVGVTSQITTTELTQTVTVETNLLNPNGVNIAGTNSEITLYQGQSSDVTESLHLPPSSVPGTYQAQVIVLDSSTSIFQDMMVTPVTVGMPDLVLTYTVIDPQGDPPHGGGIMYLGFDGENQGDGAAGPSNVGFYLSSNTTYDDGDVLLGSQDVSTLPPGADFEGEVYVTIPIDVASGAWYILFYADAGNDVDESNENNNVSSQPITITGSCEPPNWTVDEYEFEYNMTVTAELYIDGDVEIDPSNIIAAFVDDEIRGVAYFQHFPPEDHYVAYLTVWSNSSAEETIALKGFDYSSCQIVDLCENLTFQADDSYGSVQIPFPVNNCSFCSVSINLVPVWNWISVNVDADDMSLNTTLASINGASDRIKSQEGYAEYYSGSGWYGSLTEINPRKMYKIRMTSNATLDFQGDCIDPAQYPISLTPVWNWLGYLPYATSSLNDALSSINGSSDRIKGQEGYAEYYSESGWYGSLTDMSPGAGYKIRMTDDAILYYPSAVSQVLTTESSKGPLSQVLQLPDFDYSQFEYNMSITAEIDGLEDYLLIAYVDDEVRGIARAQHIPPIDKSLYMLSVYSNQAAGDAITFKLLAENDNSYLHLVNVVEFQSDLPIGSITVPCQMTIDALDNEQVVDAELEFRLYDNYPNPFNPLTTIGYQLPRSAHVTIRVYDPAGRLVKTLVDKQQTGGNHEVVWDGTDNSNHAVSSGLYFYHMQAGEFDKIRRCVLLK
ncbi:MAG: hypothetical protein B6244_11170 [Candidatus Cloacimonetes bacterium 4572_55]|nr:MAG: hypothetical protein B6244_11170 [Candidatus Cloacimonetes bacterium 4572_55]